MTRNRSSRGGNHGKRIISECVSFVEEKIQNGILPHQAYMICAQELKNSYSNIRRWFEFYIEWGEISAFIVERLRKYKVKRMRSEQHVAELQRILDLHPEYYLDEFANELAFVTGVKYSVSTISRVLRYQLDYSLQVCYHRAAQRDAMKRNAYKTALAELLFRGDPKMACFVDETHKDRNASR